MNVSKTYRTDTRKQIKEIKNRINGKIKVSVSRGMDVIAPIILDTISQKEPEYNNYSGNLNRSYHAAIYHKYSYSGNKSVKYRLISLDDRNIPFSIPKDNKFYLTRKRHSIYKQKKRKYNQSKFYGKYTYTYYTYRLISQKKMDAFRYKKKWESSKKNNYVDNASRIENRKLKRIINNNSITDSIVIFNSAPYADYVQRKNYNVLSNNMKNNIRKNAISIIKSELSKSGIKFR